MELKLDFDSSNSAQAPFSRSLRLILQTILRQQQADVACLYVYDQSGNTLVLRLRAGQDWRRIESAHIQLSPAAAEWVSRLRSAEEISAAISDYRVTNFPEVILNGLTRIVVAPLRTGDQLTGLLTTGWKAGEGAAHLDGIMALTSSVAALLARSRLTESATDLVTQIAQLEAELADLKIAERARGLFGEPESPDRTAHLVKQHVQRVLEGTDSASLLRQQLEVLREQVRDRQLLNRAKSLLQQAHRMSEEEAYLHLRNTSRRERRPLRDVAVDVLRPVAATSSATEPRA